MNTREIIKDWLVTHDYDGLAGDECGCTLEDICMCDEPHMNDCKAGNKCTIPDCPYKGEFPDGCIVGDPAVCWVDGGA